MSSFMNCMFRLLTSSSIEIGQFCHVFSLLHVRPLPEFTPEGVKTRLCNASLTSIEFELFNVYIKALLNLDLEFHLFLLSLEIVLA